jgi:hypothetical protein
VSFSFEQDYLQDLEPVLSELDRAGFAQVIDQIEACKASGSTGGEILSCIYGHLRLTLTRETPRGLRTLIEGYLRKAPGY